MGFWELDLYEVETRALFEWCLKSGADRILLFLRTEETKGGLAPSEVEANRWVLETLSSKCLETAFVSAWPGTVLTEGIACAYLLQFDADFVKRIPGNATYMDGWIHANQLPEDPCIFKQSSDSPLFHSVTHEDEGWIISQKRPDIAPLHDPNMPFDEFCRFIPQDRCFLRRVAGSPPGSNGQFRGHNA